MDENKNIINLLFAATSDYLPLAAVTAVSIKHFLPNNTDLCVHFMFADIVKNISDKERQLIYECANETFKENSICLKKYNVAEHMHLFEGQNVGLWGKNISMTHYMYLLAPMILKDIDKIIYLDTDIIVNTDLSKVYNMDMQDKLICMAEPRGFEEMGDDVSNSGFIILNLQQWRKENTLDKLLEFGKSISETRFCDQNLLYQYFTKKHNDRLLLIDKTYNIFPQLFYEIPLEDIKILHYTGYDHYKPWQDLSANQRAGFLWWKYARKTAFYETFFLKNIMPLDLLYENLKLERKNRTKKKLKNILYSIFSLRNEKTKKVITILGIKFKFKRKKVC